MQLRTTLTTGITILALGLAAVPAAAGDPTLAAAPFAAAPPRLPIFAIAPFSSPAVPPDASAIRLAAAAQATAATTSPNEHQFGVGVRIDGANSGIGASVRYFFYGGPLGVQAEIIRRSIDFGVDDWSSVQFSPSVLYRFREQTFDAPISLTPYAGAGLSFVNTNFGDDDDFFEDLGIDVDDTDVGVLLYGGVEIFFERIPNLGASGELTYSSNDDIVGGPFDASLGGVAFTAAAHWYFW